LKLNEYVAWTANTCAKLSTEVLDDFHMFMGIITETGELFDAFKKQLAYNKPIDWINVKEEVGDIMFYIASFCRMHDFDLEEIIETNKQKLESRYPEKFSTKKAINRDLKREREILEK